MVSSCEKAVGVVHSLTSSVTVALYQPLEDSSFSHCFLIEPELWVPHTMAPQGFLFHWECLWSLCAQCRDGAAVLSIVSHVSFSSLSPCADHGVRQDVWAALMCCLYPVQAFLAGAM